MVCYLWAIFFRFLMYVLCGEKLHNYRIYYPKTNGKAEHYSKTYVKRLCHFVADHQREGDQFAQPLTLLKYPSAPNHESDPVYFCAFSRITRTNYFHYTDVPGVWGEGGNPVETKSPRLLSRSVGMWYNTDKWTKAVQQQFKRHHDAGVRKKTLLHVHQLMSTSHPPLLTSAADKMALEAYLKFHSRILGPYRVTSMTWHTIAINQDGISNTFFAVWESLTPTYTQAQNEIVDSKREQSFSDIPVRSPGISSDQQGRRKIREIKCRNIASIISVDKFSMAIKWSMWSNKWMPVTWRHAGSARTHSTTLCNLLWKRCQEKEIQRQIKLQIWV